MFRIPQQKASHLNSIYMYLNQNNTEMKKKNSEMNEMKHSKCCYMINQCFTDTCRPSQNKANLAAYTATGQHHAQQKTSEMNKMEHCKGCQRFNQYFTDFCRTSQHLLPQDNIVINEKPAQHSSEKTKNSEKNKMKHCKC